MNRISQALADKRYERAIKNSTGAEKIRLLVRRDVVLYLNYLKKKDGSQWIRLSPPLISAYSTLVDVFYGMLEKIDYGDEHIINELATSLSNDFSFFLTISARAFGITFGITITKAAIVADKKVNKASVKDYLTKCKFNSQYQKEIISMATSYINFEQDKLFGAYSENGFISKDLRDMASALISINPNKKDFPLDTMRILYISAIKALEQATIFDKYLIKEIKDADLIR